MSQSISQRRTRVSCRGYGSIPQAHGRKTVNQGGTADKVVRPWQKSSFVTGVFCFVRDFCNPVGVGAYDDPRNGKQKTAVEGASPYQ